MKRTILNVCLEKGVRISRELLLKSVDYEVISCASVGEFEDACQKNFDLVIFDQTILPSQKHEMAEYIRKHRPHTEIAELYDNAPSIPAKHVHRASPHPKEFLEFVESALQSDVFDRQKRLRLVSDEAKKKSADRHIKRKPFDAD